MDQITTAIVAALAGLSKDAIKDSYNALKSALKKKFTRKSLRGPCLAMGKFWKSLLIRIESQDLGGK